MTTKYIFVLGGVVSGLGKGITAASLGRLLKSRGLKVTMQKLDPYLNIDPGTMNPLQHGEVFVTEDGAETDLDIGHYERFIDENLNKHSNYTSGKIYNALLENERNGVYAGATVQMIPHVTNMIKDIIRINAKSNNADIAIVEIGGTVGDYESLPHMEAIRQFSREEGYSNCMYIHVALIPFLTPSNELKTKPVQHSVKELLSLGIQPDILVCRTDRDLGADIRQKLALFCNVPVECVLENKNVPSLYEIPLALEEEGLAEQVLKRLKIKCKEKDLSDWIEMVERSKRTSTSVKIGIIGKYTDLHDAYLSVVEALKHAAIFNSAELEIKWVNSQDITEKNAGTLLGDLDGILIPGGFGERGTEGKINAARYARENKIPYFGLCLGMQTAIIEFARHVANLKSANSREIDPNTPYPVIDLLPGQNEYSMLGGSLRLGKHPCKLTKGTKAFDCYNTEMISERHRHRYEVNNDYRDLLVEKGMIISGASPNGSIVEMIELPNHPWFVACQFHPEFKSRPNHPHPLFMGFIRAAIENM
ncbi:MAG: CTP synthase [Bacteroidetes bacterium]|nr:CTP synthase [Bacteroidota bacterium]MCL2302815.1 CTP synthase [Lentimicrobiaceae bacterium]